VLNHVMLHQTVIGQEAMVQMAMADAEPDIVIGCVGGGSNFAGLALPYVRDKIKGTRKPRIIAVEPEAAPSLTKGLYAYDFGDVAGWTPLLKMFTLGHSFVPAPVHAGGLRYHGMSPIVCHLKKLDLIEAVAVHQKPVFEAALQFARTEGIIPAPESAHAIRVAIDEALACKQSGEAKTILFGLSGHGHFDLSAYDEYLSGDMQDYEFPQAEMDRAIAELPNVA